MYGPGSVYGIKEMMKNETLETIAWCWNKSTLTVFHDWDSVLETYNSEGARKREKESEHCLPCAPLLLTCYLAMSLAQPLVSTKAGPAQKQPAAKEQPLVGGFLQLLVEC